MSSLAATCDAGCGEQFIASDFKQADMGNGIEKIYLTCTHCGKEYVAFYSDNEIKKLQQKIRNIQQRFANPRADHKNAARMEAKTKAKIKARMDRLRERMEAK